MKNEQILLNKLDKIDGKGYGAYNELRGKYLINDFILNIEYVQGDPYASPSRLKIKIDQQTANFPRTLYKNETRKIATEDFLTRKFSEEINKIASGHRGSGKSGLLSTVDFGQAILFRTSCQINKEEVQMVFNAGLPAKGRTVLSKKQAKEMIFEEIIEIVEKSLKYKNLNDRKIQRHVEKAEDATYIRTKLEEAGLVGFIAEGSLLPRESGVGDLPMNKDRAVEFKSPESLKVDFDVPNSGNIEGMGIPEGITLIVGGGYHGKSTLLDALANGVYNHVPGDGRELAVAKKDSAVIRAEDGRYVQNVDITPFISDIPSGISTENFSTKDASGSTSQASNIIENLELGTDLLLIDEDTSATNFMIRDERMQELVSKDKEPITPLIDKIRPLYEEKGVSTVLVMGGSGDYFDVADTVIMMDSFIPRDVSEESKEIAKKHETRRENEGGDSFGEIKERAPQPKSINPRKKSGKVKIKSYGKDKIRFGYEDIDLNRVPQISEAPQTGTIGDIIFYAAKNIFDGKTTIKEAMDEIEKIMQEKGIHEFTPYSSGNHAKPRKQEIAAALNRLRSLKCKSKNKG